MPWPRVTDTDVTTPRPPKNRLDPWRPYAFVVEPERSAAGTIDDVMTIFLTNRECPFRCTMCDLWKNTLDERVPLGAIPAQIDYAIQRLSAASHVKLYNAGNFFDAQAIPPEDHEKIATRIRGFDTVIVENHPRLTDTRCLRFRDLLQTRLEVAMGLETIHPAILESLNKRMTVDDFDTAVHFLTQNDIDVRTFVLLKPPGLSEVEGIEWAVKSVAHAVEAGSTCISVIPTRAGNGLMEQLQVSGQFSPPSIRSMEETLERGFELVRRVSSATRVFMDVWDAPMFFDCELCGPRRAARIQRMNFSQQIEPGVTCDCDVRRG